ncbi:sensor domain-containing diguanylate cyclase [Blastococcus saxobsidens]|uniref:Diguanylate cyclase (GGDEF) domain-containing protein n=1 Tax=Blastococcus saxobsidens (strain DD2) TaxID=1146883 RepID=H6RRV4_BLASD|nr:GGDEF domain-containing protein [Blastococcus saxobsidens]CCG02948.1 Diguanylate cyclase (GGDEF) domain-containing protein [Blastococcus saxobsidens DD2]
MIDPDRRAPDLGIGAPEPAVADRVEREVAALTLAVLLVVGALMGSINLFVDGVLRAGAGRWAYGGTMLLLLSIAVSLAVRGRVGGGHTFALVLIGDLIYLVVVLCIEDPLRYATPLMLLFPALVAAWFLGLRQLCVHMVATAVVCLAALWPSYDSAVGLGVQVGVNAGTLNAAAVGVFLLRRRVQRLLVATETLSRLDPLTGLFNRRYLVEQAPRLWGQARRDATQVSAMVLDLDHFKRLNDEFGHAVGDSVLGAVARSLSATVRPADVLARTGGEELVVLGAVTDLTEAIHLAERLRAAVAESHGAEEHAVTASVGLAVARPVDGEDPVAALWRLVDRADVAMYEAKRTGRDRVCTSARSPEPEQTTVC